jgi:hypothetical protein
LKHLIPDIFYPAKYLEVVTCVSHRNAMTRLRLSSHRLAIETGRWTKPPLNISDRKCTFCGCMEDEYHMIFECDLYKELRTKYIPKYYRVHPSMIKCQLLFRETRVWVLKKLGNFIYKAFKARDKFIFGN